MTSPILALEGVNVTFGGLRALSDVHLEVFPGQVVGLIGPNGAGKTTLFNVMSGFVTPESGSMAWEGELIRFPKPDQLIKRGMARTLQGVGLFSDLTCVENVMVALTHKSRTGMLSAMFGTYDRDEAKLRIRAMEALEFCGAADLAKSKPSDLAFPLLKRVSLARALVAEPKLLLLDEPAGGLGAEDLRWLAEIIKSLSCAVLLVEHHMDVVMAVSEKIYVLDFGQVIASGAPEQVRQDPGVIAAYLGAAALGGNNAAH
ncbi:MAG: ABC transporter ATP-binding protein [Actinobacteria bacterium]|nr:MAG: ABC transporter ATP-binding protein [Actinomycetota bacterium]